MTATKRSKRSHHTALVAVRFYSTIARDDVCVDLSPSALRGYQLEGARRGKSVEALLEAALAPLLMQEAQEAAVS